MTVLGRRYALIIGNSHYEDRGLSQLVAPAADVAALAEVLRDTGVGAFDEVQGLVNEGFASTLRAIARFFDDRKREDLLLLYFSGHGIRDEYGHLHLAVRDTERELLAATAVQSSFVTGCMDRSASKRLVLVLDCCHSGAFGYGAKSAQDASVGTAVAFEGTGRGRVVLTATDSTQYAWQGDAVTGEATPSVFTRHLTDGLKTGAADLNGDGIVTLDELYDYVYDQVVNDTSKQTPGKWVFGQQGDIVIARNRAVAVTRTPGTELPKPVRDDRVDQRVASRLEFLLSWTRYRVQLAASAAVALVVMLILFRTPEPQAPSESPAAPSASTSPISNAGNTPLPAGERPAVEAPREPAGPREGLPVQPLPVGNALPPAARPGIAARGVPPNVKPPPAEGRPAAAAPPVVPVAQPVAPQPAPENGAGARAPAPAVADRALAPAAAGDPPPAAAAKPVAAGAAAPAIVPVAAAALVKKTIDEYKRAAEALDSDGVKRVWPAAPDALRVSYRNLLSQSVDLDCSEPAVTGDSATVSCLERVRSVGAGRVTLPPTASKATFSLRRNGDAWEISRIARQPAR